jgi:hypothetical protein
MIDWVISLTMIGCLAVVVWKDKCFPEKEDSVRMNVFNYYVKHFDRYKTEKWIDVLLDYCNENHKKVADIVKAFDYEFLETKIHSAKMLI